MEPHTPTARDIVERVLATFAITVVTLATADGINWSDWGSLTNWQTWATAGLAAGFALLKNLIGTKIGGSGGSWFPSVRLRPVVDGKAVGQ